MTGIGALGGTVRLGSPTELALGVRVMHDIPIASIEDLLAVLEEGG
jgi:uncharacterized membrane protein